ncbi:MAG: hypothetical protein IPK80_17625 [Nannocystis sp.]|nr:hypothetical protein [Nannocystis sp.]
MSDIDPREFRRTFINKLSVQPLDDDDPRYVDPYELDELAVEDPVRLLAEAIEDAPAQSVQLFSGFRGTGKSTQLRRLRKRLVRGGYAVLLIDIEDYLNTQVPVDIADFLLALTGAAGEALDELLGPDRQKSAWDRLARFFGGLKLSAELAAELNLGPVDLKLALRQDKDFPTRVREAMTGRLSALVREVRSFFEESLQALPAREGRATELVLLVDSVEHIRGSQAALDSLESLFAIQHENLRIPYVHVVYTVPPYLKVRSPNLHALYDGGVSMPMIKVRERDGSCHKRGIQLLREIVAERGDWTRLLGPDNQALDRLILLSGGYLRDLFQLLREIIRRATSLPASPAALESGIRQVREEYTMIAERDVLWLDAIRTSHGPALPDDKALVDFARFLDTGRVFCYRNGEDWYGIHPLIADHVTREAKRLREREAAGA